jgi:hypothetical protein
MIESRCRSQNPHAQICGVGQDYENLSHPFVRTSKCLLFLYFSRTKKRVQQVANFSFVMPLNHANAKLGI